MGILRQEVCFGGMLAALLSWQSAHAIDLFLTDFDDTLLETRISAGGTFGTPYKFKRVNPSVLLPNISAMPETVWITPQVEEQWRNYFAINADSPTQFETEITLEDGTKIRPGFYYFDRNDGYERYLDNPTSSDGLKIEFASAAEKANTLSKSSKKPRAGFAGPTFSLFQAWMSNDVLSQGAGILTARGHGADAWKGLFGLWNESGFIQRVPAPDMIFAMSHPSQLSYEEDKSQVIVKLANQLERRINEDRRWLTARDGVGQELLHSIVYADDNQAHLEKTFKEMRRLTQVGQLNRVKMIFINTGTEDELNQTDRMGVKRDLPPLRAFVLQRNGQIREASRAELIAEIPESQQSPQMKAFLAEKNPLAPQARCASVFNSSEVTQ